MQDSNSNETLLYLIRHGATDANERRPYILQGCGIDLPLNANGRHQAAAVARFLSAFHVKRIYSSALKRAIETAQAVAEPHRLAVGRIEQLAECNVGQWEGLDWETISRDHADAWRAFHENPADVPYLGGESYRLVLERVRPIFERLLAEHAGETIAVVAHNVVNRVYLADLLGLDLCKARDLHQANGCVNVIRRRDGRTELVTLNSSFHLLG
jgi:broad specificity phosphatase PhoE